MATEVCHQPYRIERTLSSRSRPPAQAANQATAASSNARGHEGKRGSRNPNPRGALTIQHVWPLRRTCREQPRFLHRAGASRRRLVLESDRCNVERRRRGYCGDHHRFALFRSRNLHPDCARDPAELCARTDGSPLTAYPPAACSGSEPGRSVRLLQHIRAGRRHRQPTRGTRR